MSNMTTKTMTDPMNHGIASKIPVIDFSPFLMDDLSDDFDAFADSSDNLSGQPLKQLAGDVSPDRSRDLSEQNQRRQQVAQEIYDACHQVGFLYLKNHGVPQAALRQIFDQSQRFFAQPADVKQQLAWTTEESNCGYIGVERETLNRDRPADFKECFNMAHETVPSRNHWHPEDPAFRTALLEFYEHCTAAAQRVFRAFEWALKLPPGFIENCHSDREHILRLLHYPPIAQPLAPDQIRAGEHADYGSLTLLFQDDVGGLEVRTTAGEWVAAPCIADTVLVNTGDLMQHWSNDQFRSTQHRVNTAIGNTRSRYAIAFFCQPNNNAEIACIDSCQGPDNPAKYPPVLAGEYLLQLLKKAY